MLPKEFAQKYEVRPDILHKLLDVSLSSIQKWMAPGCDREVPAYIRAALALHDERLNLWLIVYEQQVRSPIALVIHEQRLDSIDTHQQTEE